MTPVIGEVPLGAPPDENVEMNEPHDSEDPSRVMDTDNSWVILFGALLSQHIVLTIPLAMRR